MNRSSVVKAVIMITGMMLVCSWQGWSSETSKGDTAPHDVRKMAVPTYDAEGRLQQPIGFERWIVVGTSVGLSYAAGEPADAKNPGEFHQVYMQPEAFDHYVRTGEFCDQTVFVVTNNRSLPTAGKDELNRHGYFAAPSSGLEVAVKDTQRFADGWAYFMYHGDPATEETPQRPVAKAFAREDCFDCHAQHGAQDNVFTQFYSVLNSARARRQIAK